MSNLDKVQNLIDRFVKIFKDKHQQDNIDIEGIFLTGSFLDPKRFSKNSDMDLFLIVKNTGKRYRGVAHIDGVEIDYFINPLEQIAGDLEKAKEAPKKTMAHILAGAEIILDKNAGLDRLKVRAKELLAQETGSVMPEFARTLSKYSIDDYLKDLEDGLEDGDVFAWQYNKNLFLNYLLEVFCRQENILLVKPKYQKEEIIKKDARFIELYEKAAQASFGEEKNEQIKKLAEYVMDKLGGHLPEDWEMESQVSVG